MTGCSASILWGVSTVLVGGGVIPSRNGCQSKNNDQLIALHTPEKIEIELKNHPFAKEYHLNQTFLFGFQNECPRVYMLSLYLR